MKLRSILIVQLLTVSVTLYAQSSRKKSWSTEDYSKVTYKTFRSDARFKKEIDLDSIDYRLLDAALFYLTNEERAKNNIAVMEYAPELEIAAWNYSKEMATKAFFSHNHPTDKARKDSDDRGRLAGITNPYVAENIAANYASGSTYLAIATAFHRQWMGSPGHKANILSEKGVQMGCGLYYYKDQWFGTEDFQWFEKIEKGKAKDTFAGE